VQSIMRVTVIGGGPSGLVSLELTTTHEFFLPWNPSRQSSLKLKILLVVLSSIVLTKMQKYVSIFFQRRNRTLQIGYIHFRSKEKGESELTVSQLVSSRQLTTFSDYRYKPESPDFLFAEQYCAYLEGYCKSFSLNPHISLSTSVTKIERSQSGGHTTHLISSGEKSEWHCDAVAICTGLHVTPNIPEISGLENVPVIHSSEFKERKHFGEGNDVLILGSGETDMDIAYLAVTSDTKSATISHRDGFLCAPKVTNPCLRSCKVRIIDLMKQRAPGPSFFSMTPTPALKGNVPYDLGAASLFDTAYIHPLLRDSFLPWWYYDPFSKYTTWLVFGTKVSLA
jgi:dimethylaniline monooxygenase (N-oxide forming)